MRYLRQIYGMAHALYESVCVALVDKRLARMDSFKRPLVTVVVPLYNEERFVLDCLNSIRQQSYRNWECVVVNDCSTDGSPEIVEKFAGKDPRFRLVHHEKNSGLAASRNTGLECAKGELITFLDSDDFLFTSSIWQRVRALELNPGPDVAGSFCGIVSVPEDQELREFNARKYHYQRKGPVDFLSSRGECPFNAHAPMLKTSLVRAFSGFGETMLNGAEDWDLWSRILRHGYRFVPSHGFGAAYRQKNNSMVRRMPHLHVAEAIRLVDKAHQPKKDREDCGEVPFFFSQPLHYYEQELVKAKRIIGYATMAYFSEREDALNRILDYLDPSVLFLMDKISCEDIIDTFARRYYCLGAKEYNRRNEEFARHRSVILKKIVSHLEALNQEH